MINYTIKLLLIVRYKFGCTVPNTFQFVGNNYIQENTHHFLKPVMFSLRPSQKLSNISIQWRIQDFPQEDVNLVGGADSRGSFASKILYVETKDLRGACARHAPQIRRCNPSTLPRYAKCFHWRIQGAHPVRAPKIPYSFVLIRVGRHSRVWSWHPPMRLAPLREILDPPLVLLLTYTSVNPTNKVYLYWKF